MASYLESSIIVASVVDLPAAAGGYFRLRSRATELEEEWRDSVADQIEAIRRLTVRVTTVCRFIGIFVIIVMISSVGGEMGSDTKYLGPALATGAGFVILVKVPPLAVRPVYRRIRGITEKPPNRLRTKLLQFTSLALMATLIWGVLVGVPGHGISLRLLQLALFYFGLVMIRAVMSAAIPFARGATALPEAQRAHFMALAAAQGVRLRDVLTYPGRGLKQANAFYVGVLPRLHYILVSDYLLDHLAPEEIDAIIYHEIGHAKGHDLLIKLTTLPLLISGVLAIPLLYSLHSGPAFALMAIVPWATLGIVFLIDGRLGVKLEERADDLAASEVGADVTARALSQAYQLNDSKTSANWLREVSTQHPGLDRRVLRLIAASNPSTSSESPWLP